MATSRALSILDSCRVPPAPAAEVAELTLPLTFFDMIWLHFHTIQRLLFYPFPCTTSYFQETVVPKLKQSLSQTLEHYLPLAGNLLYSVNSGNGMPEFRYVPGDTVSLTVAEYLGKASDFLYLAGNQAREANQFYAFILDLPEPEIENESGFRKIPVFAIQVTLFPETGFCMGFTNHHTIGDASSIVRFIKAWSLVARLGDLDESLAENHLIPFYDRSVIDDPSGRRANIYWNQMKQFRFGSHSINFPNERVRGTFVMQKNDIQRLKNLVRAREPGFVHHLSSYTVVTAYVWACLAKSSAKSGEDVDDDEPEYFGFGVDARGRVNPPIPMTYFGNCVAFAVTESRHGTLKGSEGFFVAVELIGETISKKANNKDAILSDADDWLVKHAPLMGKRNLGVVGSPKFDLYDTDFGWGKPNKFESVSIDNDSSMSLCNSREFEGGLEIGMSLPKKKMDAFGVTFSDELKMSP